MGHKHVELFWKIDREGTQNKWTEELLNRTYCLRINKDAFIKKLIGIRLSMFAFRYFATFCTRLAFSIG